MSLIEQKKRVFGNIAAAKTLTEGMPKLKLNSSFPSINNNGDSITFLCDLIKSLIGYDELQKSVTDTLVHYSKPIETEVKNLLKLELKSIVSCSVDPSLPSWVKSTGTGVKVLVNKIDFTDLMLIDPNSDSGKLLYNDLRTNLINSSDFNTFLYQVIQNNGTVEAWPQTFGAQPILTFQFKSVDVSGIDPNNTLTIKAHPNYDNKTLTDLNNDFIDSISLFNLENLMTNIFDSIFGTVSNFIGKSLNQIQSQIKINGVIDKISNADANDIINKQYFTFTDKEKLLHEQEAKLKKAGVKKEFLEKPVNTKISIKSVQDLNNNLKASTSDIASKKAITDSLNSVGNQVSSFATSPSDKQSLKSNFIQQIINNLIRVLVNTIISPKIISIFVINFKIIYGPTATYTDAIDFLQKNKNLIHNIIKRITGLIIKSLLKIAMKKITQLVAKKQIKKEIDAKKAKIAQLLSLLGIPQDTIRKIKGLL